MVGSQWFVLEHELVDTSEPGWNAIDRRWEAQAAVDDTKPADFLPLI